MGLRIGRQTLLALLCVLPAQAWGQSVHDEIGLTHLRARLGASTPTGSGIDLMLVEGQVAPGAYLPSATAPELVSKVITDRSGGGSASTHATSVASIGFGGLTGIAPGVINIDAYRISFTFDSGDWVSGAYLNFQGGLPQAASQLRLQNHSWAAGTVFSNEAIEVVRRFDYALRRDNVVAVAGIANQTGSNVPAMMGSSYNAIVVGNSNGASSWGPTTGDVAGRAKPDIVGPYGVSSYSTPVVSGCAAILMETADVLGNPHRARTETIKAVLLSGATKEMFANLSSPWPRTDNGIFVEPLDRRFGAGLVNVNHSHLILSQDEKNGTDLSMDGSIGWDYETLSEVGDVRRYFFASGNSDAPFTATATWLRRVAPTGTGDNLFATSDATLSTIEMRLFEVNADLSMGDLIDASLSPVDNVQHIFREALAPSRMYVLEIRLASIPPGQSSEDYAVAWHVNVTAIPEPGSTTLFLAAASAFSIQASLRRLRKGRG